jgi:transcriptional regulator with XRE-family HTH domain
MTDASTLLRTARLTSSLSQGDLAIRVGIDQSRVSRSEGGREIPRFDMVDKMLAATGHGIFVAPTRRADAAAIGAAVNQSLTQGNPQRALRLLIQLSDNLNAEHGLLRGLLGLAEPESTGHKIWDAAIAAVVAWRLGEEELPLPAWVSDSSHKLERARVLVVDRADPIPSREDVPEEFLKRGVLIWRDTFASV